MSTPNNGIPYVPEGTQDPAAGLARFDDEERHLAGGARSRAVKLAPFSECGAAGGHQEEEQEPSQKPETTASAIIR